MLDPFCLVFKGGPKRKLSILLMGPSQFKKHIFLTVLRVVGSLEVYSHFCDTRQSPQNAPRYMEQRLPAVCPSCSILSHTLFMGFDFGKPLLLYHGFVVSISHCVQRLSPD